MMPRLTRIDFQTERSNPQQSEQEICERSITEATVRANSAKKGVTDRDVKLAAENKAQDGQQIDTGQNGGPSTERTDIPANLVQGETAQCTDTTKRRQPRGNRWARIPRDATGNQRRHRLRPQTRLGSPSGGAPGGGTGATHTQHKATATTGRHLAGNPWARTRRQLQE
jgi:hypothetical protein